MQPKTANRHPIPWRLLTLVALCLFAYCAFAAGREVSDPAGPMTFDVSKPFKVDFGRGSGMDGLETIAIMENGKAAICRRRQDATWERASVQLSAQQLKQIAQSMKRNGLPRLAKKYLGKAADGTQWVLWIRQGTRGKATYFDNNFPGSIRVFAIELDSILRAAGIDNLAWEPSSKRDKELWSAIK